MQKHAGNNIVKSFKAAGITRNVKYEKNLKRLVITLKVDRSCAKFVRHWNTDKDSSESDSEVEQQNHLPEYPRISIPSFD